MSVLIGFGVFTDASWVAKLLRIQVALMKIYNVFKKELFQIYKGFLDSEYRKILNKQAKLQSLKSRRKLSHNSFSGKAK